MKEKKLSSDIIEELVLRTVDDDRFNHCVKNLNSFLKSTDLQEMAEKLRPELKDKTVVQVDLKGEKTPCEAVNGYFKQKRHYKADGLNLMATFLADANNCQRLLELLPKIEVRLLHECLEHFYVLADEVMEWEGFESILSVRRERWSGKIFELHSPWFSLSKETDDLKDTVFICLRNSLYAYFHRTCHPQFSKTVFPELPEGEVLRVLETEESVHRVFPLVMNLYERGAFENTTSNKLKVSVIRKCAQQLGDFEEFFPDSKEAGHKNLRASLFFTYMVFRLGRKYLKSSKKMMKLEDLLKDDERDVLLPFPRLSINVLLPHVKGIYAYWDMSYCYFLFTDIWLRLMDYAFYNSSVWFPVQEVIEGILNMDGGLLHLHLFSTSDYGFSMGKLKNGKTGKEVIHKNCFRTEVAEPYVKAVLLMMASAGLFDVAFRDYREEDTSWVDGLQYARLTDLGKYVLGFSKKYEPHFVEKQVKYIDIDPERLIIRSLVDKNPYDLFLSEVAKPIGNRRYVVSQESFLRKCQSKQEVKNKMDFFVKYISPELSPVWKDFFDGMLKNCNPFQSLRLSEYSMYQVAPENKALIHLLNTDANLRKLVIRAENFIFLVKDKHLKKFREYLKSLGYIL